MPKRVLEKMHPVVRQIIRITYVVVILVLGVFAWRTWDQLQALRTAPVALPNFWFYMAESQGKPLIQASGTWLVTEGAPQRDRLQTSTIECQQARMQCVESTAVVTVIGGSFLESVPRLHDVEAWDEKVVITKPFTTDCSAQVITLNIADKTVTSVTTLLPNQTACKTPARTMQLGDGAKAKAAPGKP